MIPAPEYKYIDSLLNDHSFKIQGNPSNGIPKGNDLVGFIFFDQNIKRPIVSDFLENINILNAEAGSIIHFFLPGVSLYASNRDDVGMPIGQIHGADIYHNPKAFISFKDEFEKQIPGWKYEYGVDIILIDIANEDGKRVLNFSSAIFFKVEAFVQLNIIERTSQLIGKLIKFRRDANLVTSKDAKKLLGQDFGINWFKSLVLAMFPKAIQDLARAEAVLGGGSPIQ